MTNELEQMKEMIKLRQLTFIRNVEHLRDKLEDLKKIGSAIGEVSEYDCLAAVKKEINEKIDKMLRKPRMTKDKELIKKYKEALDDIANYPFPYFRLTSEGKEGDYVPKEIVDYLRDTAKDALAIES